MLASQSNLSGIIFEDYNKGFVTSSLITEVISFANNKNIPVFVDPKFDNFFSYKSITVFKPNRKEAQQALGIDLKTRDSILLAGKLLLERLECDNVLLTLGADGMMLFESDGSVSSEPTRARHVADVSGAGDTAIATLAASIAAGGTIREAATLANFASGSVCEEPGIVSITKAALLNSISKNNAKSDILASEE
jgi:D-beta-D-heptose 7-phosphate kinase/D-beta-D-heptose 1-phosphate adenosyltransferase